MLKCLECIKSRFSRKSAFLLPRPCAPLLFKAVPKSMFNPVILAPNLEGRLLGVTTTIARFAQLPVRKAAILSTGPDLPATAPHSLRGWQARRNTEMVLGLTLAHLKRRNLKRIFRPTYQRKCSVNTRCAIARTGAFVATSTDGVTSLPRPATALHHGTDACAHVHCYFTLENTADALIAIYQKLLREVPNPCRIRHIGDDAHSTRQGRFDD